MHHAEPPSAKEPIMPQTPPKGDRIAKVIARAGVASRREAERMIELGQVSVNGVVIDRAALNVTPADKIVVNGKPLDAPEPPRLWLYHKPTGLVTTNRDEQGRTTIFDELPEDMPRVLSIGRLDLNSEGLLLLTNDGAVKRQLELPSTGWLRRYRVRVNGRLTDAMLEPLRQGIVADGETFQPMIVTLDRQKGANAWLTVGLREGKNREIRRAMDAIGVTVNRLIRISYGPFQLGQLKPGAVEELRRRVVRDQLGLDKEAMELFGLTDLDDDKPAPRSKPGTRPRASRAGKPGLSTGETMTRSGAPHKSGGAKPANNIAPGKSGPNKPGSGKSSGAKPGARRGGSLNSGPAELSTTRPSDKGKPRPRVQRRRKD